MKTIFSMNSNEINDYYDKFIKEGYPDFKFLYDWSEHDYVEVYLKRLMLKSIASNSKNKLFLNNVDTYINDVEEFIATGLSIGIFNDDNLVFIIKDLNDKVRSIEYLPEELQGCYGRSTEEKIQINPRFNKHSNSPDLSSDEVRQMYMFHELGHKVLNVIDEDVIEKYCATFKRIVNSKGDNSVWEVDRELVLGGFWLIEEALVQELAEILIYNKAGKRRPEMRKEEEFGYKYKTNLDFYGLFQEATIRLGSTMRGCGEYYDDPDILKDMIKRCIDGNFCEELIAEYSDGNAKLYVDLCRVLQSMGNILNEKYASFGQRLFEKRKVSPARSFSTINNLCSLNQDFRDYPSEGIKMIDFDYYLNGNKNYK